MEMFEPEDSWLNYHHLRYFCVVAREGSISRASRRLSTSQPAVCAQVKQLEAVLGEALYRRSGRSIVVTEFGRMVQGYAEEIFGLGRELVTTAKRGSLPKALRLHVGVVDSFPKLLSLEILRPLFEHKPPVHLVCREGKLEDLLGQLGSHRLDVLLTDEPPPSSAQVKTFSHLLGSSGITFCGTPKLLRKLPKAFPKMLDGAPLLLPTQNTAFRRELEQWFRKVGVLPRVVGEFEDAALAKIVAADGIGLTVVPSIVAAEAMKRHGFSIAGKTEACRMGLYVVSAERRLEHPAIALLLKTGLRTGRKSEAPGKAPRPKKRVVS